MMSKKGSGLQQQSFSMSFDEVTLLYQRFMRIIGLLPFKGRDFTYPASRLLLVYFLINNTIEISMLISYIADVTIKGKGLTVDMICETVLIFGITSRYYLLAMRRLELADLLAESRDIWAEFDDELLALVRLFERKIRLLFKGLFVGSIVINASYYTSAASMTLAARADPRYINDTPPRYLPFKWYTENGEDLWPGYEVNFALQLVMVHSATFIITTTDSTGPLLAMLGAGYFRALRQRLLRAASCSFDRGAQIALVELVACTRLHQRILKIEGFLSDLFFIQLLCTGYNISLIGIKLAGTDPDRYKFIPLVLLQIVQMFVCQWAPDNLIDESTAIGTAAYSLSLTWMRSRVGKHLVLIIARSQHPVQMTAAGVVNLSLEKFGSMLTSAISFFTVLRNFNV